MEFNKIPLSLYLGDNDQIYYAKALELRDAIQDWLAYVPQTFPHYTRHTIQHSEEIVLQLSHLLFEDDDFRHPTVALSAVETYILIASAYLHDAGMVSSDKEKTDILASPRWQEWTSGSGGGSKRWREIQRMRDATQPTDPSLRHFLADIQTRFLIAEFIRQTHHIRAVHILAQHQDHLATFAFDDPILQRTITDVCLAHGLRQHELQNRDRYPDQRDIRGQKANVMFLAALLRLGDLLDLSSDRACPLLLNAACPLPAASLAHWTQYRRIIHRSTTPQRIEITAECDTQEEHRVLQDWCQWLVDEIRNSGVTMSHSTRHSSWRPPECSVTDPAPTIIVRPSEVATYIPSRWALQLDLEEVFQRLINDLYTHPLMFVRELIQNALDATRCKLYIDLSQDGTTPPEFPTQVDAMVRRRYQITVSLTARQMVNPLSGEPELRQWVSVDDPGIGMDRDIIERYLLQVGRSYYTTDEFRRHFKFIPTSRFGVGFLSVFSVSDKVLVETYKPISSHGDSAIRLTLTGPRNYILTERANRLNSGTRVEVLLRESIKPTALTQFISHLCRRVEFPIMVNDLDHNTLIEAEKPDQFTYEVPTVIEDGTKFAVRSFPINRTGTEGEIYVFSKIADLGEAWDAWNWAQYSYPTLSPRAVKPQMPQNLTCINGISFGGACPYDSMRIRIDYRKPVSFLPLFRQPAQHYKVSDGGFDPDVRSRIEELLAEHLASSGCARGENAWKYKQRLAHCFPIETFWRNEPDALRIYHANAKVPHSLESASALQSITVILSQMELGEGEMWGQLRNRNKVHCDFAGLDDTMWALSNDDLLCLSEEHRAFLFQDRTPENVRWLANDCLAIEWTKTDEKNHLFWGSNRRPISLVSFSDPFIIGFSCHKTMGSIYSHCLLNKNNRFVEWLVMTKGECMKVSPVSAMQAFERLMSLLNDPLSFHGVELQQLTRYVADWAQLFPLRPDLHPPKIDLTRDMFAIVKWERTLPPTLAPRPLGGP